MTDNSFCQLRDRRANDNTNSNFDRIRIKPKFICDNCGKWQG